MNKPHEVYQQNITEGKQRINTLSRQLYGLSALRFLFFGFAVVSPFVLYGRIGWVTAPVFIVLFAIFLILVKRYIAIGRKRKFEQAKVQINEKELLALEHRFDQFDDGKEFIDPNHMNAYDLDIFGKGSLFQFINRTVTPKGKEQLAKILQEPMLNAEDINKRQEFVQELTSQLEWRQNFSTYGSLYGNDAKENDLFQHWSTQTYKLHSERWVPVLLWILPVLSIAALMYWIFAGEFGWFLLSSIAQGLYWNFERKNIGLVYSQFGKRERILQKYEVLLKQIETYQWKSKDGQEYVQRLVEIGLPSKQVRQLRRIISLFDNRINMFAGAVLNAMFLWDVRYTYKLIKWHRKNKDNYPLWIKAIAFIDANNSLSNYAYNNEKYIYPEFTDGRFELTAEQMGHPLINPKKRIDNDFELKNTQQIVIITGANMSGKSTFLRTIGVNMVLGMAGAPVCAKALKFKPVEVFSNMRTTDSLFDDESYFFAELKRLQMILEEVDKGREILIILDEILKGTNSVDKLHGSQKLLDRLIHQGAPAIIATHDLKLTEIEQEHPDNVKNQCFEITIENDEMQFDYTLRSGVTTIMNASFLMKKMGIIK